MSAVAEYIHSIGKNVSGYDRDNSLITKRLIKLGIDISHKDDTEIIDFDLVNNSNTLVVYTPAISNKNCILNYFKKLFFWGKVPTSEVSPFNFFLRD